MPAPDTFHFPARRVRLFFDRDKREAEEVAAALAEFASDDPAAIVVIGGDGTMLRAIRQHWRDGLPFYGLNTGHLGFLLNDAARLDFWDRPLRGIGCRCSGSRRSPRTGPARRKWRSTTAGWSGSPGRRRGSR